jgi:conjugal transfer pilus assembly protein TraL
MDLQKLLVPRKLDEPPRFFFWEFDVALVFLVMLGFGILTGQIVLSLILGVVGAVSFSKMKSGQHPGYLIHMLYWHLPLRIGFKRTPPSYEREFVG